MSASTRLRAARAAASIAALFVLQTSSNTHAEAHNDAATAWYSGFTLPELLAEPHPAQSVGDIRSMLSEPWYGEILVTHPGTPGEPTALSSCAQYFAYPMGSISTLHAWEGTPFMALAVMCHAAKTIVDSQAPRKSHIPPRFIDEHLPRLLPPQVAMILSVEESKRLLADKNKRSWADINRIKKATVFNAAHARFEDEGGSQDIELVARGDFNGDGIEDVLFTSRDAVEGGSYSALRLFSVTRLMPGGRYELVREYLY